MAASNFLEELGLITPAQAYEQIKAYYLKTGEFPDVSAGVGLWSTRTQSRAHDLSLTLPSYHFVVQQMDGLKAVIKKIMMEVAAMPREDDTSNEVLQEEPQKVAQDKRRGAKHVYPASLVARIVQERAAGGTFKGLARKLNAEGLRTIDGGQFTSKTIGNMYYRASGEPDYCGGSRSKTPRTSYLVETFRPTNSALPFGDLVAVEAELVQDGEMPGHLLREDDPADQHLGCFIPVEAAEETLQSEAPVSADVPAEVTTHSTELADVTVDRDELAQLVALAEQVAGQHSENEQLREDNRALTYHINELRSKQIHVKNETVPLSEQNESLSKSLSEQRVENEQLREDNRALTYHVDVIVKRLDAANHKLSEYDKIIDSMRATFADVPTFQ